MQTKKKSISSSSSSSSTWTYFKLKLANILLVFVPLWRCLIRFLSFKETKKKKIVKFYWKKKIYINFCSCFVFFSLIGCGNSLDLFFGLVSSEEKKREREIVTNTHTPNGAHLNPCIAWIHALLESIATDLKKKHSQQLLWIVPRSIGDQS